MKIPRLAVLLGLCAPLLFCPGPSLGGETVKDREAAVRGDRAALENDARWIYNDFQRGLAQAKATGKPLLVVLRCVPCLACGGIDARVLNEWTLAPLLDQFVCVRVINANALDLSLFQFDYDLSFSTLFFNGDGTVYGRYGSWVHQKDAQDKTITGYQRALEAALAIHHGYPANKASLAGKQGGPTPFKTPVEIPALAGKYRRDLDWDGKVVASCVHCHQIGDAFRASYRDQGKPIPRDLIYPMPAPETIGLKLTSDDTARAQSVTADSPAARAGILPGDRLVSLAGQPLISIADVSWVLHHAPESAVLPLVIDRAGAEKSISLALPSGWRDHTDISRRVGTWELRAMACGGLLMEDLADSDRAERGLKSDQMALFVKYAGEYGKHAAAKKAGFQKGDVLVSLDGHAERSTESEVIGRLMRDHQAGDKVPVVVLRGKDRLELSLPIQ